MSLSSTPARSSPYTPSIAVADPAQQPMHTAQKRLRSEDEEQEAQAKRARNDSITTEQEQCYNHNKQAIEAWCKMQQMQSSARWYEKLHAWETNGRRDVRRKSQATASPPAPITITQTTAMDSAAEIIHIRQQWGDLKPDQRTHALDKLEVPEWPTEDSLENSVKRPNGMYKCMHSEGSHHKCCREGVTAVNKKHAIAKQVRVFKSKVEDMVLKGNLYVAHKTWRDWNKKNKAEYSTEAARWDKVLAAVQWGTKAGQGVARTLTRRTSVKASRHGVPQQHRSQPFVAAVLPAQQMFPLQQATHAHPASRQFQHQFPKQQPLHQSVNPSSIATSRVQSVSPVQPQPQHVFTKTRTQSFTPSAVSTSPASVTKHGFGGPTVGYAGPQLGMSPRQRAPACAYSQYRSQEDAVIASATAPVVARHVPQVTPLPGQTLSPVTSGRSHYPIYSQTTLHSMDRQRQERQQQQQAPPQPRNLKKQQAAIQLPPSGAVTNYVIKTRPAPTRVTTSPSAKPHHTSASTLTSHMSSPAQTLSPDRSSVTLVAASPVSQRSAVDYRTAAARMLQKLIKDFEPIALGGLKITRVDVNRDMSGCLRRLTTALQLEAEAEETLRKEAEEAARIASKVALHADFGNADGDTTNAEMNAIEGHELDFLFSSTPILPTHSFPIDFGNVDKYLFDTNLNSNEWRPEIMLELPPDFGRMDLIGMTQWAFAENPSPTQPREDTAPQAETEEEDSLEDLSYPEAWFIEDVGQFVTSGPIPEWMQRPTTNFTLEQKSNSGLDIMTPSDPQDWLRNLRVQQEETEANQRRAHGGVP
ncbi:hypothetical protein BKA58DRAFT_436213 [Alternaria rosae]|uniref:uncharacterized protein n=1 Tax=Alternaria rosae TaxID=1187941 RepID=UPI001E8E22D7|nr:uncharacterized protein BKA58DRAFT_436213 [Alternaria rosae]KAH6878517.1 hypothetical protein BKA58DRAFT_436213 [Alternaria rosae]